MYIIYTVEQVSLVCSSVLRIGAEIATNSLPLPEQLGGPDILQQASCSSTGLVADKSNYWAPYVLTVVGLCMTD